jgi:hypothetical protein
MPRPDLLPDCEACVALCCVAPAFDASADFALDKPAGLPCPNLTANCRCAIHDHLAARGFQGCVIYTCHGAGQRATAACAGLDAATTHAAFLALREIHECLWLVSEAQALVPPSHHELAGELRNWVAALDTAAAAPPARWLEGGHRADRPRIDATLRRVGDALGRRPPSP